MKQYLGKKLVIYLVTFFLAVTIDWAIPRFMPGNPVQMLEARMAMRSLSTQTEELLEYYTKSFELNLPLWQQYINFWKALFHGNLGVSISLFPKPVVEVIKEAVPYDILLLLPMILLSWLAGNKFGAFAARSRHLDNTLLPAAYVLSATPYMWLAMLLVWWLGVGLGIFPIAGGYSFGWRPQLSWGFIGNLLWHWFLPFASMFLVQFGSWAIGMRNMIIYELESDYSHYLEALGAPRKLVRRYAFRNALLPQITGVALQLGSIVTGAVATEIVFAYPGTGHIILQAIQNQDYFLIQGCFLFIIIGILLASFAIDILYVIIDPRTRKGVVGI